MIQKRKYQNKFTSSTSKPFCGWIRDGDIWLSPLIGTNCVFDGRNFGFAGTGGGCGD
jgi:hypothetical protein